MVENDFAYLSSNVSLMLFASLAIVFKLQRQVTLSIDLCSSIPETIEKEELVIYYTLCRLNKKLTITRSVQEYYWHLC